MSLSPISQGGLAGGPQEIGRYSLLFRFAAGGMAEVFVGRMSGEGGFEKPVAIKRMLPALAEEPRFVDMFLDEARIAAMVSSPHVVPTFDVGKDDEGSPYIVMELVIGLSLSQLMRGLVEKQTSYPPLPMIVEILAQAAQGLDDAHTATRPTGEPLELVHRDVSPQNILVGVDGRARLTDFGVARAIQRVTRTSTGEVKGKLSYFSPEQARNQDIDQRSDVFALGVVAWEMIAGRRLFQRDDPMSTLRAVLEEPIPLVSSLRPDVPPALANAIAIALQRDREQRFESAGSFAHALRSAGVAPPTRAALGKWIEGVGGDRLKQFQGKIATAFGASSARDSRAQLTPVVPDSPIEVRVEPSQSAVRTVARSSATPAPAAEVSQTSGLSAPLTPAAPSSSRAALWVGLGVAVTLALVAVIALVMQAGETPQPVASSLAPPPTTTTTTTTTLAAPPVTTLAAPVTTTGTTEEATPSTTSRRPAVRHGAGPETPAPPTTVAAVAPPPTTTVAVVPPPPPPEATTAQVVPPPPTTVARTRPITPREVAPAEPPPTTTAPRRRLLGLDHFERETTGTP